MSRILLVDDSPHALRMGERILADEGYEVVAVSNADSALIRLEDVDPDVVVADTVMPGRTGYDICSYLKMSPRRRYVKVILTSGVLETMDEEQVKKAEADGTLKKPFEATALLAAIKPLAEAAEKARSAGGPAPRAESKQAAPSAPFVAVVDAEQVEAAVTVALDASMEAMVREITRRVVAALSTQKTQAVAAPESLPALPAQVAPPAAHEPVSPEPLAPPPGAPRVETVRRVTPLRQRSGSILGLNLEPPEHVPLPPPPPPGPHSKE
jgi:CheY-like chemotaxis protein